jgi:hypothetical protein
MKATLLLLLVAASICFAETDQDALSLIQSGAEVARATRATESWHIEGTVLYSEHSEVQSKATFALLQRSPGESRFEQEGGPSPVSRGLRRSKRLDSFRTSQSLLKATISRHLRLFVRF